MTSGSQIGSSVTLHTHAKHMHESSKPREDHLVSVSPQRASQVKCGAVKTVGLQRNQIRFDNYSSYNTCMLNCRLPALIPSVAVEPPRAAHKHRDQTEETVIS
jgi:hypothetical protein